MNRKRARFDVVGIEVMVYCPQCDTPARSPWNGDGDGLIWTAAAVQHQGSQDVKCAHCRRWFRLSQALTNLLRPTTEPVRHDQHVGAASPEIICGNCAGEATEPFRTLLATNRRCATCGGDNYTLVARLQPNPNSNNGKETSE